MELPCTKCMMLASLFIMMVHDICGDRQSLERLNEMSWNLRQLTNHSSSGSSDTVKEVAIVVLPCKELVKGSYLRRFLNKLLMYSNVDYQITRVSMWVGGDNLPIEDQIRDKNEMKTFCTLMSKLKQSLVDRRRVVPPDFNSTNLLSNVQDVIFPSRRLNHKESKYFVIVHCGLKLKYPDNLALLNDGHILNIVLPQPKEFDMTDLISQTRGSPAMDSRRKILSRPAANRGGRGKAQQRSQLKNNRRNAGQTVYKASPSQSYLLTRARPNFIHPAPVANRYSNDRIGVQRSRTGYGRIDSRFSPHPTQSSPNKKGVEFILKELRELDTLSSKAFINDLQGPLYSPANGCLCRREFDSCMCNRQTGDQLCLCQAGHYQDSRTRVCKKCPENTFSVLHSYRDEDSTCVPCPDMNHISPQGSTEMRACVCKPGYKAAADNSCDRVTCPLLSFPENGLVVGGRCNPVLNAACGIRCDTGYALIGSSVRMCGADGQWSGINATCQVKQCKALSPPKHGSMRCTNDNFSYATRCKFTCAEGYTLLGPVRRSCLSVGHWSGIETFCQDVKCPALPRVMNGYVNPHNCTSIDQDYGVSCKLTCRLGYNLIGPLFKQCSNTGTWVGGTYDWQCIDNEPPDLQCPDNITITADPQSYLTTVPNIKPPKIRDKSSILSVVQLPGQLVSQFPLGEHEITYRVEDVWNNMAQCAFTINVIDTTPPTIESCLPPDPVIADLYARTTIIEPQFSDNSILQLSTESTNDSLSIITNQSFRNSWGYGITPISFTAADQSGNNATCEFNVTVLDLNELCVRSADMQSPTIFTCDSTNWTNAHCYVECSTNWGLALAPQTDEISCDSGAITPNFVPDCSEELSPLHTAFLSSSLQISESCEDHEEITRAMESITHQLSIHLITLCTDALQCNGTLIEYNCMPNATFSTLLLKYRVNIEALSGLTGARQSQAMLQETVLFLEAFLSGGLFIGFTLPDGFLDDVSFSVVRRKVTCGQGQVHVHNLCYHCPRGTYLGERKECVMCPRGTYQDKSGSTSCVECPPNMMTQYIGSKGFYRCLAKCKPGTYSPSGLDDPQAPCRTCEMSYYQSKSGQTHCTPCYSKYTTSHRGSPSSAQCIAMCIEGYVSRTGAVPCVPCPSYSYQPEIGKTYCLPCPTGSSADESGAKDINECRSQGGDVDGKLDTRLDNPVLPRDKIAYSECFQYPCLQLSTCHSLSVGFYCECQPGYIGTFCETEVNECHSAPCLNGGRCLDLVDEYTCQCTYGWTGIRCEVEVQECLSAPCQNGASCVDRVDGYNCLCRRGFTGQQCENDIDECSESPCQNDGSCVDLVGRFSCTCLTGYQGRICQSEINECEADPCTNRGVCVNSPGSFRCECLKGFEGELCEADIDECSSSPCLNNAVCEDHVNDFFCHCRPGYGGRLCDRILTSDYILSFDGDDRSYAYSNLSSNTRFTALSVSFWMRTDDRFHLGTPFSYANLEYGNAFTLTDYTGLMLRVNNEVRATDIVLNDGVWHFVAVTWTNLRGVWQIYIDGVLADGGTSLRHNDIISGGGRFLIGQEQDNNSTTFNDIESYVGEVTFLQVWNHVISESEIRAMYTFCEEFTGNLITWPEFRYTFTGTVVVLNSTFCGACDRPTDLINGETIWEDVLTAAMVIYVCEPGYNITGDIQRSCLVTGLWSGEQPVCHVVDCGQPPDVQHSDVVFANTSYRNAARYECLSGYTGGGQLTCGDDGKWIGTEPNCTRVVCLLPPIKPPLMKRPRSVDSISNDVGSGENLNFYEDVESVAQKFSLVNETLPDMLYYVGDVVSLVCGKGYVIVGAGDQLCTKTGQWSRPMPYCELISDCITNPPNINGSIYVTNNDTGTLVAEYECLPGWEMSGNSTLPCLGDSWLNVQHICERRQCPPPSINNSIVISDSGYIPHQYGDSIQINCQKGHKLIGSPTLYCNEDGSWDNLVPSCEPVICTDINITDGHQLLNYTNLPPIYGTRAVFSCDEGFEIIGESVLDCAENGVWSESSPHCQPRDCGSPRTVPHAIVMVNSTIYQNIAQYSCNRGYKGEGNETVQCSADGFWSESGFRCLIITCRSPDTLADAHTQAYDTTFESQAHHICRKGYHIENDTDSTEQVQTCNLDGAWTPRYLKPCVRMKCREPGSINNGFIQPSNATNYGDFINFKCEHGYNRQGPSKLECLADGTWNGSLPTCRIVTCLQPANLTNGVFNVSGTNFGDTVAYECDEGFNLVGYATSLCTAEGVWSNPAPVCDIVTCPQLGKVKNGNITTTAGTIYKSQANLVCDFGFENSGGSHITCQANGVWSGQLVPCQETNCPMLPRYVNHGAIQQNETTVGATAEIVCDDGYELRAKSASSLRCNETGVWDCSGDTLELNCTINFDCESVTCPDPVVNSSTVTDRPGVLTYQSVIKYSCPLGYTLKGSGSRECLANQTWSGVESSCDPITCPDLSLHHTQSARFEGYDNSSSLQNYTATTSDIVMNTIARFYCEQGYRLNGSSQLRCTEDAVWSHSVPTCLPVECAKPPDILHGILLYTELGFLSNVSYQCEQGYSLVGRTVRTCKQEAIWSGYEPNCIPISCPEIPSIPNGRVQHGSSTYGSNVTFTCSQGFTLKGPSILRCEPDGQWDAEAPDCETVSCPAVDPPEHGQVSGNDTYRSVVVYSCNEDYVLTGIKRDYCQAGGRWLHGEPPKCERKYCPEINPVENGEWYPLTSTAKNQTEFNNETRFPVGINLQFQCDDGYTLTNPNITIQCLPSMHWNYSGSAECAVTECPELTLANGTIEGEVLTYKSSVRAFCNQGYHFQDDSDYQILYCEQNGKWNATISSCDAVTCAEPPEVQDGFHESEQSVYTFNSTISYACRSGFSLSENQSIICNENGDWIYNQLPVCNPVTCKHPGNVKHGQVYGRASKTLNMGERIVVVCGIGYELNGALVSKCQENGHWSSGMPRCNPINCPPPANIPNGRVIVNDTHFKAVIQYECEPGYALQGSSERMCLASKNWNGIDPSCISQPCNVPPQIANGRTISDTTTLYPNSTVEYRCSAGFDLIGNSTVSCDGNGRWPVQLPQCVRVCLNPFLSIENSIQPNVSEKVTYSEGDMVEIECQKGYYPFGNVLMQCHADGYWEGKPHLPLCEQIRCPILEQNHLRVQGENNYNSTVTFLCEDGFSLVGIPEAVCLDSGSWNGPFPNCVLVDCGEPKPVNNGSVVFDLTSYGSNAVHKCNLGYTPGISSLEDAVGICSSDGAWEAPDLVCLPVQCPRNLSINHGDLIVNMSTYGGDAYLKCEDRFMARNGVTTSKCDAMGLWFPPFDSCVPLMCSAPGMIEGALLLSAPGIRYLYGDTTQYRCLDGFEPEDHSFSVICTDGPAWSGIDAVRCNRTVCPLPDTLPNEMQMYIESANLGFNALFQCLPGYNLRGSAVIHCDGLSWSDEMPVCAPRLCEITGPQPPPNGTYTISELSAELSEASLRCEEGFEMFGVEVIFCNQTTGWENATATCNRISCSPLNLSSYHVLINQTNASVFYYGDELQIDCQAGYELEGPSILSCDTYGNWSSPYSRCTKRYCPTMNQSVNNGSIVIMGYSYKALAILSCNEGYKMDGPNRIICGEDGLWTSITTSCIEVTCSPMRLEENMMIVSSTRRQIPPLMEDYNVNDTVRLGCSRGYDIKPSAVYKCGNGDWNVIKTSTPFCSPLKTCRQPRPPDTHVEEGSYLPRQQQYYERESVTYSCSAGYTGSVDLICSDNSTWQHQSGSCEKISCGEPSVGDQAIVHGKEFTFRGYVAVTCPVGYRRLGGAFIRCQSDGNWTSIPQCLKI